MSANRDGRRSAGGSRSVIGGSTQSGLVSIQLFTTVIPLIIIGFSYFSGFAANVSPGSSSV